ncbi:hypothetical protein D3875_21145 [Deinococcus cavernae]|uniref:Uncharacterized protein n=1 Tax=Deinococcus cavernae TaxID=2320857 RepID=A0A418UZF3_9DEIO|nr:hypothetical protein [Deinococcus cavernae]RJF68869.1 hypothetical protein D3875_21145 [Deinococcus cavernae]
MRALQSLRLYEELWPGALHGVFRRRHEVRGRQAAMTRLVWVQHRERDVLAEALWAVSQIE